LNCRSKRNPGISDTIQFVPDRIASISDIEFVSSKMHRDPRSPSMVLPRCMLSTVVRDICEPLNGLDVDPKTIRLADSIQLFSIHRHAPRVRPLNVPNPVRIQHSCQYHPVM